MKYFYTDPLIVAYMARNFKIYTEQGNKELGNYLINDPASFFHFLKEELPKTINSDEKHKYYIHLDCHEMIKPQRGDIIICDHMGEVREIYEIREDWCSFSKDGGGCNFAGIREIIQRGGKPFFNPEVEDV